MKMENTIASMQPSYSINIFRIDRVAIILNVNPKTGMNHLLNAVFINGIWLAIEPQAYANNNSSYWMKDGWGNKYDYSYNQVATDTYARYVE